MKFLHCLSMLSVLLIPQIARSAEVFATSYDMRNGVSPNCRCRHYWDRKYNGTGDTTTDGSFLSGGLGDLTDGIVTEDHWNIAEELDLDVDLLEDTDGIGPYVGWRAFGLNDAENNIPEPEITFHFAQSVNFSKVSVHYEDHPSDVFAPSTMTVTINDVTLPEHFPVRNGGRPKWTDIDLAGYSGNSLLLKLVTTGPWTLIDEVKFFDANAADPCDLNGNGRVDGADVAILYNNWGTVSSGNPADKDGSGTVDGADLGRIYDSWTGDASPTSAVPEPTGSALFVVALAAMRRRS